MNRSVFYPAACPRSPRTHDEPLRKGAQVCAESLAGASLPPLTNQSAAVPSASVIAHGGYPPVAARSLQWRAHAQATAAIAVELAAGSVAGSLAGGCVLSAEILRPPPR